MYEIVYLEDALNEIRNWPIKVRVNYFRIASLIEIRGPNLGMPHTRAMGKGLFEVRAKRNWQSVFLYGKRQEGYRSSRLYQEIGKDSQTRFGSGT